MNAQPLSSYLHVEPSLWDVRPWTPPTPVPTIGEAVSLVNKKDGTRMKIALMQAGGKTFLQAAAERNDKPLSRGVFTKMLKQLAPSATWKGIPGMPLHAVAFLTA